MDLEYRGELYALGTGLTWAIGIIFFRLSGFKISPSSLNLFKNSFALVLLIITLLISGESLFPGHPIREYAILFLSGLFGLAVADTLLFMSLNILGASAWAVVECFYAPSVIFFGFLLLGEKLSTLDYVGGVLILMAITILSRDKTHRESIGTKEMIKGIALGAASMLIMSWAIVMAKPILEERSLLWSNVIRTSGGIIPFILFRRFLPDGKQLYAAFRPAAHLRYAIPGAFFGAYIALICWIGGFKYTTAGSAAILNQLSTVFIILMGVIFLREAFSLRKATSSALAIGGAVLVFL